LPGHFSSKNCKAPNFFRNLFTEVSSGDGLSAADDKSSRPSVCAPLAPRRLEVVVGQPADIRCMLQKSL